MSNSSRPPGVVETCHRCGQPLPENVRFCPNCGAPVQQALQKSDQKMSPQPPGVPTPPKPTVTAPPSPRQFVNVSFWPRVLATLIDGFVVLFLQLPILFVLVAMGVIGTSAGFDLQAEETQRLLNLMSIPMSIVQIAYFTIMNGTWGATLGKMALGMRIVRADGSPISYGIALGRIIIKLILAQCTCSLMYLSVAINTEHRGWHDQIIGTRVIYDQ